MPTLSELKTRLRKIEEDQLNYVKHYASYQALEQEKEQVLGMIRSEMGLCPTCSFSVDENMNQCPQCKEEVY